MAKISKKQLLYPVTIGNGLKKVGNKKDWYLYQQSDRKILVDYKTKAECLAAKEIHDWIRENLTYLPKRRAEGGK